MSIWLICYLLFIHWMVDFVFQSDSVAKNKSSSNTVLLYHCLMYGIVFALFTVNALYGFLLGLIHFPVDYITSRINKKLYASGRIHAFFVSIGFDQLLHFLTIFIVWGYLRGAGHVQ